MAKVAAATRAVASAPAVRSRVLTLHLPATRSVASPPTAVAYRHKWFAKTSTFVQDANATSMELSFTLRGRPRAQELAQQIRFAILEGRLRAGTRLPSTRALAESVGCSRTLVT
ncbi:MAG: GntR family transcriptional regulator, partial [Armatimonadota bacterium]|nr:GntR family transcriptional regulator [Armatimonadota bacterium]